MTNRLHTDQEVLRIVQQATSEVLGSNELTTNRILGGVATKLAHDPLPPTEPNHETRDYSQPPNYAVRAIKARTSRELADLIAEAADRLSKSIAPYHRPFRFEEESPKLVLTPTIFAEGSTEAQGAIGSLHIEIGNKGEVINSGTLASLWLEDGEDMPCDPLQKSESDAPHFHQILYVRRKHVMNPISGQEEDAFYVEVSAEWLGRGFSRDDGKIHESKYGKPIGAKGEIIKAKLFWALDMAIRYYEEIYRIGNEHIGLFTYADYRDAGCLDNNLTPDHGKADQITDEQKVSGQDHKARALVADPDNKAEVKRYIDSQREYLAAMDRFLDRVSVS